MQRCAAEAIQRLLRNLRLVSTTSYFGIAMDKTVQTESAGGSTSNDSVKPAAFDARLIAEFDGSRDVVEWFKRAELLCEHSGVSLISVLPLRLTGGAFSVWSQLPADSRSDSEKVRTALYAAFALDEHAAYEAFTSRRLRAGESADVFLAELRRLAALFGDVSDRTLVCAFVAGLPDSVRQIIRAGSRAEGLGLSDVLARARSVLSDERLAGTAVAAAAATRGLPTEGRSQQPAARVLQQRDDQPARAQLARGARGLLRCWICGVLGHISAACPHRPGNSAGDAASAPASSPGRH